MVTNVDPDTGELFDSTEYQVPFPKADGHDVTDLALRIGGSLKYNRHDPEHAAFLEQLRLGDLRQLTVFASVDGKSQAKKEDGDGNQQITHTVTLRIHSIEPA